MQLKMLEWRRVNKVDGILQTFTPPEVFTRYFSFHHISKDKMGCPRKYLYFLFKFSILHLPFRFNYFSIVWISSFGRNDLKGIALSMTKKDIQLNILHLLERMAFAIRVEKARNTGRQLLVFDMDELSIKQITNKSGIFFTDTFEAV